MRYESIQFYSLQKSDKPLDQLINKPIPSRLIHLGNQLDDFNDTAAALKQLDVLITVDTSILHLAGALGIKTYALLQYDPDWRWMTGRDDTPWYQSVTLIRQPTFGDWQSAMQELQKHILQHPLLRP